MRKGILGKIAIYILVAVFVVPFVTQAFTFNRALGLGSRGEDVSALQQILKGLGYFTYPTITGYYGAATQRAVQALQSAAEIVSGGTPKTTGYGRVGPQTRAFLNIAIPGTASSQATLQTEESRRNSAPGNNQSPFKVPLPQLIPITSTPGFGGGGGVSATPQDTTPPSLSAGSPSGTLALGTTNAALSLTSNESAACKYATTSGIVYGAMTAFSTTTSISHSTSVTGLANGGSYIYYVKCADTHGNTNTSDYTISFAVAADATSPTVTVTAPTNNAVVSGSSVTASATATDDVSVAGVQFKLGTSTNIGSEDTSAPYSVTWNSTGVADGVHTLIAVARDGAGNYATSSAITVTVDNAAPLISAISSGTPDQTSATITWTTNEAADSQVNYGATTGYGTASSSASLTTSHSVTLTGLTAGTTYHFQIRSADEQRNVATSSDQTFIAAYDSDALTLFSAMAVAPSTSRKGDINNLVITLKSGGVWDKLSTLQVYSAHDAQAAALNWVNPVSGPTASVASGTPTFEADKGWKTDGIGQIITTSWIPSNDSKFLQDNATQGIWSNYGATGTGSNRGAWGAGPSPRAGDSLGISSASGGNPSFNIILNANYATSQWNYSNTPGWMHGYSAMSRSGANTVAIHNQGIFVASTSNASVGRAPRAYWLGALNNDGSPAFYGVTSQGAFFAGGLLSDSEHSILSSALSQYMLSIGNNNATPLVGWGDSLSNGTWYAGAGAQSDATGRAYRRFASQGVSAESSAQIAARMLADTQFTDYVQVIWAGRNDINNGAQTVNSASVLSNVAAMVAAAQARSNKYLVVGVTNGNLNAPSGGAQLANSEAAGTPIHTAVVQLNSDLAVLYGDNFLDIRSLLVAQGLNGDANDQADAAADVPPRHLMYDDVHFSVAVNSPYTFSGNAFNGRQIELKLEALGY